MCGHSSGAVLALEAARLLQDKIKKLALYEPPFIVDDSRAPMPEHFMATLDGLVAAGRRGEAVEMFQRHVGIPPEMIAQFRSSPMWPGLEEMAPTLVYDMAVVGDTQSGSALPLQKYASVRVPTLGMDGTVFFGSAENHVWLGHAADAIARVLPHAECRTLEGQDHGAADAVLASALKDFFLE